jgi:hypothetical protein
MVWRACVAGKGASPVSLSADPEPDRCSISAAATPEALRRQTIVDQPFAFATSFSVD